MPIRESRAAFLAWLGHTAVLHALGRWFVFRDAPNWFLHEMAQRKHRLGSKTSREALWAEIRTRYITAGQTGWLRTEEGPPVRLPRPPEN